MNLPNLVTVVNYIQVMKQSINLDTNLEDSKLEPTFKYKLRFTIEATY